MATRARQADTELTREQLVQKFAAFLRLGFVYPAVNRRVIESGEQVIAGFNQHKDEAGMLRLCLHRDGLRVNQHRVELADGDLVWMRDVFLKTSIAGVDLGPDLSMELLSGFAAQLQANFQMRDTTDFRLKWAGPFVGVQPLELHVDGEHLFAKEEDSDELLQPSPGVWNLRRVVGGARSTIRRLDLDPESPEIKLLVALYSNPQLLDGLDRMRKRINLELLSESSLTGLDVLSQLVKTLPAEALEDVEHARSCVDQVLGVVEMRMTTLVTAAGENMEAALANLPQTVGTSLFHGSETGGQEPPDSRSRRPGDEAVSDDLAALFEEYKALPGADDVSIRPDLGLEDEMLGILLHQTATAEGDGVANALVPELSGLVHRSGNAEELLRAYVDRCRVHRKNIAEEQTLWRIVEFVQEHGFASSLGQDDLLDTDTVVLAFPHLFGAFLDSLEWGNDEDLGRIGDVCYGVGPERILEARDVLLGPGGVAVRSRARKILAKASKDVLPLAQVLLEDEGQWIPALAVRFLKQLKMPDTACLALRVVRPESALPRSYLAGLCRAASKDDFDRELDAQSASIVCRFIRDTADDPDQGERRLYAIRSLRGVPGQEVRALLMELKAVCGPLSFNKELRAVRKTAMEVLDHHTRVGRS